MKPETRIRRDAAVLVEEDRRFSGMDPARLPIEVWGPGFGPLVHLILGQQVSIEAADAMYANLERTLGSVEPAALLGLDDRTMRACGFTHMKAEYARGLALACLDGLDLEALSLRPDGEVVKTLVGLRGIGRWTAECYLLFCLGRPDVFPVGDLALRIGVQEITGLPAQPTEAETAEHASVWAPRRTAAAFLVWQGYLVDVEIEHRAKIASQSRTRGYVVRLREGAVASESSLCDTARDHVAGYKVPRRFVFVDEIVRAPSGKADYRWAKATAEAALGG